MNAEFDARMQRIDSSVASITAKVGLIPSKRRIEEIDALGAEDGFWDDRETAGALMRERSFLQDALDMVDGICSDALDLSELARTAEDPGLIGEIEEAAAALERRAAEGEIAVLFTGEHDAGAAIVEIKAGAGGDESCDWATMLSGMYGKWASANGFSAELLSWFPGGKGDGTRLASWRVSGERAFGWLKTESGVHRLVRISPFDSSKSRHTSFCSVSVIPEVDDSVEIDLRKSDIRVETFRAQGTGRAAPQHDGFRRADDSRPHRDHRHVHREVAIPESGNCHEDPARPPACPRDGEAGGGGGADTIREGGSVMGKADTILRPASLQAGQGSPDRNRDFQRGRGPRREPAGDIHESVSRSRGPSRILRGRPIGIPLAGSPRSCLIRSRFDGCR